MRIADRTQRLRSSLETARYLNDGLLPWQMHVQSAGILELANSVSRSIRF